MKLGENKLGESKLGDIREKIIAALKNEIEKQHISISEPTNGEYVKHQFEQAEIDLDTAEKSLEEKNYKWSIVQSYYSMFNAARAVLFKLGFRDKKHYVIASVLEELSKLGKLEPKYVDDFKASMRSREDANYRSVYSLETANFILEVAKEFLNEMKNLVKRI
jgi:uncharacterized protein (UPF0332 family)